VLETPGDILLNCSRQSGKSTVTALLATATALRDPDALVLIVSPTQRQSGETFRKALSFYNALGRPVPADAESQLSLSLSGGGRLVALPGTEGTIRSYSGVTLLIVDEASRVPDQTYHAVTPMLAVSGGRKVALSTPHGTRGWWWGACRDTRERIEQGDQADWSYFEVPATACPRITPAFLAQARREMGAWWFDQEFLCAFRDDQSAALSSADIGRAVQRYEQWDLDAYWPKGADEHGNQ
jgi:Terminase large subunit, T4likevirus-type, N-terminal